MTSPARGRGRTVVGVRNIFDTEPARISAAATTIVNAPLTSRFDFVGRTSFVNTNFSV